MTFQEYLNERAEERELPPIADVQAKTATVKAAWNKLQGLVDYLNTHIFPELEKTVPEVIPDFMELFEESMKRRTANRPIQLDNKDLEYLLNIVSGNNRFAKPAYLKSWPKQPPEWWTGPPWKKD